MPYEKPAQPNTTIDNSSMVVFVNCMRLIKQGQMTAEQANQLLDELGVPLDTRFWGCGHATDHASGRISVVYFNWINGAWKDAQAQHQREIMDDINGRANEKT